MIKLLIHQLKENLRDVLPWIILSFLATIILTFLNKHFDSTFLLVILGIATFAMFLSFALSMVMVIINDYKSFYGQNAAFFDVLPIKSSGITSSRIINIMIMTLFLAILFLIELFILAGLTSGSGVIEGFKSLFILIRDGFKELRLMDIGLMVLIVLSSLFSGISRITASITIGSDKTFKDLGIFGPILVYILITIVLFILSSIFAYTAIELRFFAQMTSPETDATFTVEMAQMTNNIRKIILAGSIANILFGSIQSFLTNYFHKNRLTVG